MSTIQLIIVLLSMGVFVYSIYGVQSVKPDKDGNVDKNKRNIYLGVGLFSIGLALGICFHVNHVHAENKDKAAEFAPGITAQFKDDSELKSVDRISADEYNVKTKECKYEFVFHLEDGYLVGVKDVKQVSCKEKI